VANCPQQAYQGWPWLDWLSSRLKTRLNFYRAIQQALPTFVSIPALASAVEIAKLTSERRFIENPWGWYNKKDNKKRKLL
jgi:hypothetical protein